MIVKNKQNGQTSLHWVISSGDLFLLHTLLTTLHTLQFPSISIQSSDTTKTTTATLKSPSRDPHSTDTTTVHSNVVTNIGQNTNIKSEEALTSKEEILSVHNNSVFQTLRDNDGYDLLIVAVQSGHLPIVHYLIHCLGHHPQTRDNFGHTPLHWAAFKGTNHFFVSSCESVFFDSLSVSQYLSE